MRTVQDGRGMIWICLELPEVPVEHRAVAAALPGDTVAIECNTGAERVVALVPAGWDEAMDDQRLVDAISAALQ